MDTGWATNVFVFICVNGFEYFESSTKFYTWFIVSFTLKVFYILV